MADEPIQSTESETGANAPEPGMALCLSGGGYRAMVFHIGVLWRLYEAGLLKDMRRISSVSGGSITAGVLALNWNGLSFKPDQVRLDFVDKIVKPLRALASTTIDEGAILKGLLLPGTIGKRLQAVYEKHLFGTATLQSLPDAPRFVINATNVQSGVLWRFSKPYMRDYRVGEVKNPTVRLSQAVAASSAFPPVLSPVVLDLPAGAVTPGTGQDLERPPFTTKVALSDGGVYDNLGLETAWKRYDTIFVSDAGGKMAPEGEPDGDWARHARRVLDLVDNQVRSLRKRQLIQSYKDKKRKGAYWGIRTDIANYGLGNILACPHASTMKLANEATRLREMDAGLQERLINWGYAVCDAAIRRHFNGTIDKGAFPYPAGV